MDVRRRIEIQARPERRRDRPRSSSVELAGDAFTITLGVPAGRACLEASVSSAAAGAEPTTRIVPLGDGTLTSLIGEELGVRTRDLAFEQALVTAREISI